LSMLAAFSGVAGDVLYTTAADDSKGGVVGLYQNWYWPAQPVPGQQARWRQAISGRLSAARPMLPSEDDGFVYTVPPGGPESPRAANAYGRLTVVCYTGPGQTGCGYGDTQTRSGTWSEHTGVFANPNPGSGIGSLGLAGLATGIAHGQWRIVGRTHLGGRPVIKLAETPSGPIQPGPATLWVNSRTHLPVRMVAGAGTASAASYWYYLKPTAANLRLLSVPVPGGYRRVR
jgi:hypothetical protein